MEVAIDVAMLAHELRNPLQAIRLASGALRSDGRSARLARRIEESAGRIDALIRDLVLVMSPRSPSAMRVRLRRAHLATACRVAIAELRASHPRARIALEVQGDTRCHMDPDRVVQVVVNLVVNALDYGAPGSTITVRLTGWRDWVTLAVHNLGEPIPPGEVGTMFEPFRRGPKRSTRGAGLGLGLSIARAIVDAHLGSIDVRSSARNGTTFTVRLPRRAETSATAVDAVDVARCDVDVPPQAVTVSASAP